MQVDMTLYRRDIMVEKLKAHARQGNKQKFKAIRPTRNGIYYQVWNGSEWKESYLNHSDIERVLTELAQQ